MTAMIAYAFAIGFIKIDILKTDLEYSEKNWKYYFFRIWNFIFIKLL
jgi:hypothetical protein